MYLLRSPQRMHCKTYYNLIVLGLNPSKSCIVRDVTQRQSTTKDSSAPVMGEWTSQAKHPNLHGNHQSTALKKPLY